MKIFKYQLKIVTVLFVSLMVLGCENDDDNGDTDFPPIARFVTSVNLRTVTFIDLSSNGDSYEWNFGDGLQSAQEEPSHEFPPVGNT